MKLAVEKTTKDADASLSSRVLLSEMISNLRECVIVVERDLRIFASNPASRILLGEVDLPSPSLPDIINDTSVLEAFYRALDNGESTETKVGIRLRTESRIYDLRVAPLNFAEKDEQPRAIGIFYDITRLERLEKVRQEFLSNVSHELRTPLTSILAFVETLQEGALEDKQNNRRFLDVIGRNAARMHHLIDDILELSAIEAGKVTVNPTQIQLAPLVEEAWSSFGKKAQRRGVSLKNEVSAGTMVFADGRRLEQILINLLSNAVKFNVDGGSITISYQKLGSFHQIRVSDMGEGISAEHLPRIFERFYRTDGARSRELGGTGLGLAIVKHLARLHAGEARVISEVGKGTTMIIELPAA